MDGRWMVGWMDGWDISCNAGTALSSPPVNEICQVPPGLSKLNERAIGLAFCWPCLFAVYSCLPR